MIICSFVGNVVAEPEMKFSDKGNSYLRLPVYLDGFNRETKEKYTIKTSVTFFGSTAERLNSTIKKGCRIWVYGAQLETSPDGGVKTVNKKDGTIIAPLNFTANAAEIVAWPPDKGE